MGNLWVLGKQQLDQTRNAARNRNVKNRAAAGLVERRLVYYIKAR
jgi:hypothetical protein